MSTTQDQQAIQKEFVTLGEEIQKLAKDRQQLMVQLNENEGVRSELALLSGSAELFRAVGAALIKTEPSDARALVDGRVEMIKKELAKIEQLVEEKGKRRLELQTEIQKIQQKNFQTMQEQAAKTAAVKPT